MPKLTKEQAISIITDCAKKYHETLEGRQLLFITKNKHQQISCLETSFYSYNFLHLTGVKVLDNISPLDFYEKCLNHKLSTKDFTFSPDGTTQLKLEALPSLMSKNLSAKMIGDFDGHGIKLYTEKLVGGIYACLGFINANRASGKPCRYVPNTVLNNDIRNISTTTQQVIAIFRKEMSETHYKQLVYKVKKIKLQEIRFPDKYLYLKNLTDW